MYTINPDRGEVAIVLDGVTYPMRPSYEAQVAIEQSLGVSVEELFVRARRLAVAMEDGNASPFGAGFRLNEMATIITECVNAAGKDRAEPMLQGWKVATVAEKISRNRFAANAPIVAILMAALFGGADPKKEPAAESPPTAG